MSDAISNLLPFQKNAVAFGLKQKKVLINLPAGAGKSLIALAIADQAQCKRVLIVCPAFLRLNWQYEIAKWFPQSKKVRIIETKLQASTVRNLDRTIAVVGYSFFQEKTPKNTEILQKQQWDAVICDESHYLRKWDSNRCRNVCLRIALRRERLIFLTATPLISSAADLHPTYALMQPGQWGKFSSFADKYCEKVHDPFSPRKFRYVGTNEFFADEMRRRAKAFKFTEKKSVILKQLPIKTTIRLPIDIGKCKHFEGIDDIIEQMIENERTGNAQVKTERERIGLKKVPHIVELLETFSRSEQIVVFCWHRSVVRDIMTLLQNEGHSPKIIVGGMNETERMARVIKFQQRKFRFLVCTIGAAGLGLNLQSASIAVFAELPYSHAEFEQCSDRVHRIGSKKPVRIYSVIAQNSIDEDIERIIKTKREAAKEAGVLTC